MGRMRSRCLSAMILLVLVLAMGCSMRHGTQGPGAPRLQASSSPTRKSVSSPRKVDKKDLPRIFFEDLSKKWPPDLSDDERDCIMDMQDMFRWLSYYRRLSGGEYPARLDYLMAFYLPLPCAGESHFTSYFNRYLRVLACKSPLNKYGLEYEYFRPDTANKHHVILFQCLYHAKGILRMHLDGSVDRLGSDKRVTKIGGPIHLPWTMLDPNYVARLDSPLWPLNPGTLRQWKRNYARWWINIHCLREPLDSLYAAPIRDAGNQPLDLKKCAKPGKITVFYLTQHYFPYSDEFIHDLVLLDKLRDDVVVKIVDVSSVRVKQRPGPDSFAPLMVYGIDCRLMVEDKSIDNNPARRLVHKMVDETVFDHFDPEHPRCP